MRDKLGICQWFHYRAYADVERAVETLRALGVRHLRTGISWADSHRPGGPAWNDWLMAQLGEFELLLSVWHTPPSIAEGGRCAGPPQRLEDYGDFIGELLDRYGDQIDALELWNEPNNLYKWDFATFDPDWSKFAQMIRPAARIARAAGVPTVLGGMIPVDHSWLQLIERHGGLEDVEVVAIHGFPGMWWPDAPCWDWHSHWQGWDQRIGDIRSYAGGRPIWISETGLATWNLRAARPAYHDKQAERLRDAAGAPAERVYWYSLIDLAFEREAIEGFHVDENEYHLGLVTAEGQRKPAFRTMKSLLANGARSRRRRRHSVSLRDDL